MEPNKTQAAPQRSEEWFKARVGKVTGSIVKDALIHFTESDINAAIRIILEVKALSSKIKESPEYQMLAELDGPKLFEMAMLPIPESQKRVTLRKNKLGERLTGISSDPEGIYNTYDMKWGTMSEAFAKMRYQIEARQMVEEAPLVDHPRIPWVAASPDGLINEDGVLEIKCLRSGNHLEYLRQELVEDESYKPEDYYPQIQLQLACTQRKWCDFVVFDSRLPKDLQYMCHRIDRDNVFIEKMEADLIQFNETVDKDIEFFKNYRKALFARADAKKKEQKDAGTDRPGNAGGDGVSVEPKPADDSPREVEEPRDADRPIEHELLKDHGAQVHGDDEQAIDPELASLEATNGIYEQSVDDQEAINSSKFSVGASVDMEINLPSEPNVGNEIIHGVREREPEESNPALELTTPELIDQNARMFKYLEMSTYDQMKTMQEVQPRVMRLDRMTKASLSDLHFKLIKYCKVKDEVDAEESETENAVKTPEQNVKSVFGEDAEIIK